MVRMGRRSCRVLLAPDPARLVSVSVSVSSGAARRRPGLADGPQRGGCTERQEGRVLFACRLSSRVHVELQIEHV